MFIVNKLNESSFGGSCGQCEYDFETIFRNRVINSMANENDPREVAQAFYDHFIELVIEYDDHVKYLKEQIYDLENPENEKS